MKHYYRILMAAAISILAFAACDQQNKKELYTPEQENEVSFAAGVYSDIELPASTNTVSITIARNSANGEITVPLQTTLPSEIKCPESVTFAADAYETTVDLDVSAMTVAKAYQGTISIADESYLCAASPFPSINVKLMMAYTWELLGTGQLYDNLGLSVDLDGDGKLTSREEFAFQDVEIYKAEGYDRWRVMNPWGNREAIAKSWGSSAVMNSYSEYWEFYLKEDGVHITYDNILYPGIMYEQLGEQIIYQLPSSLSPNYANLDENLIFDSEIGVFMLNPAGCIENTTSWFNQIDVYIALPGVDLGELFGLE